MAKYIVEIDGKNTFLDADGKDKLAFSVKADNGYAVFCTEVPLAPYTEPDFKQVREEAFKDGYDTACRDIDIKSKTNAAYQKGLFDSKNQDAKDFADMYDSGYSEGLKDAWEAARKISRMETRQHIDVFNLLYTSTIIEKFSASETIEKIQQYEQKEKITKGDVVRIKSAPEVEILVTCADEAYISGIALTKVDYNCEIGDQYTDILIHKVEKTGKHYEIAEVLRKMKDG